MNDIKSNKSKREIKKEREKQRAELSDSLKRLGLLSDPERRNNIPAGHQINWLGDDPEDEFIRDYDGNIVALR